MFFLFPESGFFKHYFSGNYFFKKHNFKRIIHNDWVIFIYEMQEEVEDRAGTPNCKCMWSWLSSTADGEQYTELHSDRALTE